MSDIRRIDPEEFRQQGYLQELNRQFLHPLGLALEVVVKEGQAVGFGGVWDYRDDPEGMNFDPDTIDPAKAERVQAERERLAITRQERLGYVVQPVPVVPEEAQ